MRHQCEHCGTRYEIPDEVSRGKRLKVRCKRCRQVMFVVSPDADLTPPPLPPPRGPFYYSRGGVPVGPVDGATLLQLAQTGVIRGRTYVYGPRLKSWERVMEAPQLRWLLDAVLSAGLAGPGTEIFARMQLVSAQGTYFPDPTLKSGLIILDETAQLRLQTLAQQNGLIRRPRRRWRPALRLAAAGVVAVLLGAGVGAWTQWQWGASPGEPVLDVARTATTTARL